MTDMGGVAKVDDILHIFPELKESEDDRIRKELVQFITDRKNWFPKEETKTSWIAWLEKQGEQEPSWSEEDKKYIANIIAILEGWDREHLSLIPSVVPKCITWLKSLKPQNRWKPSEEQMKWLKDVIDTVPMTCRQQLPLESLYNDLKNSLI